jgi:uncharacterized protein (TIGR00645 family)
MHHARAHPRDAAKCPWGQAVRRVAGCWRHLGIVLGIVILLVKLRGSEANVTLGVRSLVDLALTGSLLFIVICSDYENLLCKSDHATHRDRPEWMETIDFTAL